MVYNIDENNFHNGPGASQEFWQVGIRRGQYKLVWGQAGMLKKSGRKMKLESNNKIPNTKKKTITGADELLLELFDIENDPYEQKNLAKDQKHQEILEELKQRTLELATEMVKEITEDTVFFVSSILDSSSKCEYCASWVTKELRRKCRFWLVLGCEEALLLK